MEHGTLHDVVYGSMKSPGWPLERGSFNGLKPVGGMTHWRKEGCGGVWAVLSSTVLVGHVLTRPPELCQDFAYLPPHRLRQDPLNHPFPHRALNPQDL